MPVAKAKKLYKIIVNFTNKNGSLVQENQSILLPGGLKQYRTLKSKFYFQGKKILIVGPGTIKIAEKISNSGADSVKIIVNDFDSLLISKIEIKEETNIEIKLMEYDNTDYPENEFDLIYAQGSISSTNRNKIVKELKRIIKPDGVFCIGEITALTKIYPVFIKDIFESSNIFPLTHNECSAYYESRKLSVIYEQDLSSSLKSFYENAENELNENIDELSGQEKSYYKKLLNRISHESNAYLKLGADKYIGFKMLILKLDASVS